MPRRAGPLLAVLLALAGCGADGADTGLQVRDGVRSIAATDPETELRFVVQTAGPSTTLSIEATRDLPAGVRTQLEGRRLTATCAVPGATVAALPREWPDLDAPYTINLQTQADVPIADRATTCTLRTRSGGTPFAQVKLR